MLAMKCHDGQRHYKEHWLKTAKTAVYGGVYVRIWFINA
jgi:hypothetical protein